MVEQDRDGAPDPRTPEAKRTGDAELRRIEERITVISNWLIQGRCGDDAECIEAKSHELRALQERRARLGD